MPTATARKPRTTTAAAAALTIPKLAKGEIYVGAIVGPDGTGEHVVLLAGDQDDINHADALKWAKKLGGDLPNRVEQALLFAHHQSAFEKRAYWSNTQDAGDAAYAWCQSFSNGNQGYGSRDGKLRARAVRRVPIR